MILQRRFCRVVSSVLVCVMALFSLAVPSYADEFNNWFDVLSYGPPLPYGQKDFYVPMGESEVTFSLPTSMRLCYYDLVVRTPESNLEVYVLDGSDRYKCSRTLITSGDQNVMRFYLEINRIYGSSIRLLFVNPAGVAQYVDCLSFDVSALYLDSYNEFMQCAINAAGETKNLTYDPDVLGGYAYADFPTRSGSGKGQASIHCTCPNWQKYDYLDFYVAFSGYTLESVNCYFADGFVPFDISYIGETSPSSGVWIFQVRIDLTNIDRESAERPTLHVQGTYQYTSNSGFTVWGCVGHVETKFDPFYYFFRNLFNDVSSRLSALSDGILKLNSDLSAKLLSLQNSLTNSISSLGVMISNNYRELYTLISDSFASLDGWIKNHTRAILLQFSDLKIFLRDLINPDTDTSSGDSLVDKGNQIHNFESGHQSALSGGFDTLSGAAAVGTFSAALSFVGGYTTKVFDKFADFQVVYTLPFVLGLIFFLCSHFPRNTHPGYSNSSQSNNSAMSPHGGQSHEKK